jgi:hypothetical protein
MRKIRDKWRRAVIRVYCGDVGVNQAVEVAGLIAVAIAVTTGIAAKGNDIGAAVATFIMDKLGRV